MYDVVIKGGKIVDGSGAPQLGTLKNAKLWSWVANLCVHESFSPNSDGILELRFPQDVNTSRGDLYASTSKKAKRASTAVTISKKRSTARPKITNSPSRSLGG